MAIKEDYVINEQVPASWLNTVGDTTNNINEDGLPQKLFFTGTDHEGLVLVSLTSTQRDLLTPSTGALIWNTTTTQVEQYNSGSWSGIGGGLTDPMTTRGDIIVRDSSNVTNRLGIGTSGQVLTSDGTDISWGAGSSGGGGSFVIKGKINGEIYTGNIGYEIMTDVEDGKTIKEIRIGVLGLPTGSNIKVDIRKNGNATTDSIFTSDAPIELSTAESSVNGVYQSGVDTSGTTVGTPGTTLDAARTGLLSDDVISVWVIQTGDPITGADITIKVVYD